MQQIHLRTIFFSCVLCLSMTLHALSQDHVKPSPVSPNRKSESEIKTTELLKSKVTLKLEKVTFAAAISSIRKKSGLNFIIDDIPGDELFTANFDSDIVTVLAKFSRFSDYTWKIGSHGEIQMIRQFAKPLHLPEVNLPELRQLGSEIMSLMVGWESMAVIQKRPPPSSGGSTGLFQVCKSLRLKWTHTISSPA